MERNEVLIVGGGLVGQTLANRLSRDGYDVTLIEKNTDRVREVGETLDIHIFEGNGATAPVLRSAGIENVGLVVAATESDASNVVVGFLASHVFNTPRVVVRVHDAGHEEGFTKACQDRPTEGVCVNPDTASVERIASLLEVPGAVDVMRFVEGNVFVAGFRINDASDIASGTAYSRHPASPPPREAYQRRLVHHAHHINRDLPPRHAYQRSLEHSTPCGVSTALIHRTHHTNRGPPPPIQNQQFAINITL